MHITADNKNLIVGTNGGEIYELYTKDAKLTTSSKYGNAKKIMSAHYAPNR